MKSNTPFLPSQLIKPLSLNKGDTIGIFTPSFNAHTAFREKYLHGLEEIKKSGFRSLEGNLTKKASDQAYRSGTAQERAEEFMNLILTPEVKCLMATIGGYNSSSMIPYLDFDLIRKNPKIIIGYSDVTSLHMAILTQSGVSTFYGPALVPSFGEWPHVLDDTLRSFEAAVLDENKTLYPRKIEAPAFWSNHFRNALTSDWKTIPREYKQNEGWLTLSKGEASAPLVIANLNTLTALAGTIYFPNLKDCILLLEEQDAPLPLEERSFCQLKLIGVFNELKGLIIGKPEVQDIKGAPFSYHDLILEIIGPLSSINYPIVANFDCSHTHPMLTLSQGTRINLKARGDYQVDFIINEAMVS